MTNLDSSHAQEFLKLSSPRVSRIRKWNGNTVKQSKPKLPAFTWMPELLLTSHEACLLLRINSAEESHTYSSVFMLAKKWAENKTSHHLLSLLPQIFNIHHSREFHSDSEQFMPAQVFQVPGWNIWLINSMLQTLKITSAATRTEQNS